MKQKKEVKDILASSKANKDLRKLATSKTDLPKKVAKDKSAGANSTKMSRGDSFKILLIVLVLIAGLVSYNYFKISLPLLAFASPFIAIIIGGLIIFYWCSFAPNLISYIKEATVELKKIVWPDRKVASRMTLLVMVFVLILALYMWAADSFLQWVLYDLILRRGN